MMAGTRRWLLLLVLDDVWESDVCWCWDANKWNGKVAPSC
jgi:hypothetical protein